MLCGSGTLREDNPRLTARLQVAVRQPWRVVLDTRLSTPPDARLFDEPGPVLLLTAADESAPRWRQLAQLPDVHLKTLPASPEGVDLPAAFRCLASLDINEVLVEGGARVAGSLLRQNLADELTLYLAPTLLGPDARPLAELPPIASLDERPQLELVDMRRIGRDCRLRLRPAHV